MDEAIHFCNKLFILVNVSLIWFLCDADDKDADDEDADDNDADDEDAAEEDADSHRLWIFRFSRRANERLQPPSCKPTSCEELVLESRYGCM